MASAVEKFIKAMNKTSKYWDKNISVQAKNGKIFLIRCDGYTFISDSNKEYK